MQDSWDERILMSHPSRELIFEKVERTRKRLGLTQDAVLKAASLNYDRKIFGRIKTNLGFPKLKALVLWIEKAEPGFLDSLRDIRVALAEKAVQPAWIEIAPTRLMGFGAPTGQKPTVKIGQSGHFRVHMPFEGYLSVFNVDPALVPGTPPSVYWLDPLLDILGRRLATGGMTIPASSTSGVPVGGEPSESTLLAIATREPPVFAWGHDKSRPEPLELGHAAIAEYLHGILQWPQATCSVAMLNYSVVR